MNQDRSSKVDLEDPLGLKSLKAVIERLSELKRDTAAEKSGGSRFVVLVDQLEKSYHNSLEKYQLLKDRYALLKRSNAALCDELVWLRDQLDDMASKQ